MTEPVAFGDRITHDHETCDCDNCEERRHQEQRGARSERNHERAKRIRTPEDAADLKQFIGNLKAFLAASLLCLCLTAPVAAQTMPPLPAQCADTGRATEFGGPVLRCVDGELWYQDMDGAGGYNSGIPYQAPGTWVQIAEER